MKYKFEIFFNWIDSKRNTVYDGFFVYAKDEFEALNIAKTRIKNFKQKNRKQGFNPRVYYTFWHPAHDSLHGFVLRKNDKRIIIKQAEKLLNKDMSNWKNLDLDTIYDELQPLIENLRSNYKPYKLDKFCIPLVRQIYPHL
jgi:hypothetical protein